MYSYTPARTALVAIAMAPLHGALGQVSVPVQPIALSNQPAFNLPGETFISATDARISNAGIVAFRGRTKAGSSQPNGVFRWQDGQGSRVAKQGDPLPEQPASAYSSFGLPVVDDSGRFAFYAARNDSNDGAIVAGVPGLLNLIAISGSDSNPNPTYVKTNSPMGDARLSASGVLGFYDGAQNIRRQWVGDTAGVALGVMSGQTVPEYPGGQVFQSSNECVNNAGKIYTFGFLTGGGYTSRGIVLASDTQTHTTIAGPGMPAPGLSGTIYDAGGWLSCNGEGKVGLGGTYQETPGGAQKRATWAGLPGALQLVAAEGQAAPGLAAGYHFNNTLGEPYLNHSGAAMFASSAVKDGTPGTQWGVWIRSHDTTRLALTLGDPVANLPAGTTFSKYQGQTSGPVPIAFNDLERIAFIAQVKVPGVPFTVALLATDQNDDLFSIAATGFPFQVGPGDVRTVSAIYAANNYTSGPLAACTGDDGRGTFLNDHNQLVFELDFTDGSRGLFVAAVPCPSGLVAAGASLLVIARRRRGTY